MVSPAQSSGSGSHHCGPSGGNTTNPTTEKTRKLAEKALGNSSSPGAYDCSCLACPPKDKKGGGNGGVEDKSHHPGRRRLLGTSGYDCSQNSKGPENNEQPKDSFL